MRFDFKRNVRVAVELNIKVIVLIHLVFGALFVLGSVIQHVCLAVFVVGLAVVVIRRRYL